ncbi:MAG: polysaccharide deacetylase family protein [Acidimicrobiia bacterium]
MLGHAGSIGSVATEQPRFAVTFDDGPDPEATPRVLDALAQHAVSATFFLLANRARSHPELVRRIASQGHEIALHGFDHTRLTTIPASAVSAHLRTARRALEDIAQVPVEWFRPPFGAQSFRSYFAVRRAGLSVVVWNQECDDWLPIGEAEIARRITTRIAPGNIVLLHDGLVPDPISPTPSTTLDRGRMVHAIFTKLRPSNLRACTVGELIACGTPRRTAWFRP